MQRPLAGVRGPPHQWRGSPRASRPAGCGVLTGLYLRFCAWWKNTWATEQQAKSARGQGEQLPGAVLEGLCSQTAVSAPACLNQ